MEFNVCPQHKLGWQFPCFVCDYPALLEIFKVKSYEIFGQVVSEKAKV